MEQVGTILGLDKVRELLARKFAQAVHNGALAGLERAGMLGMRESVRNAPRSPTVAQYSATLKRKRRTARRMTCGGLEKSIQYSVNHANLSASVWVASNSYAGKYARRIHDEKGVTWRNRGAGTIAKGFRADDKFIERACRDNEDKFLKILEDAISKEVKKL